MSGTRNPNSRAMRALVEELARAGIAQACVSPGSRSTAVALALEYTPGIRPWMVTDERSAGFFALGMARASRRPVALLCTSGTAAANYLPAVVEASLSHVPLVVLTADRPPELRDCHAAQTIDQVRLFGSHVRWSVDAQTPSPELDLERYYRTLACRAVAAATEPPSGPVHLNLPMREPLVDVAEEAAQLAHAGAARQDFAREPGVPRPPDDARPSTVVHPATPRLAPDSGHALARALDESERGLLACGPGTAVGDDAEAIAALAVTLGWPILADPLSGLRFGAHDRSHVVDAYDVLLRDPAFAAAHRPDAVLQLGMPVVSAPLQRYLDRVRCRPHVLAAPTGSWPDPLGCATDVARVDAVTLCAALAPALSHHRARSPWLASWLTASAIARDALTPLLAGERTLFEGNVLARLAAQLPAGAALHVGNSLPIRALDTFVPGSARPLLCACNRGANGIDGVVSSALGAAAVETRPTALVIGDLSFLHDLGALQIAARHRLSLLIVVINNDGGGIFSFLPQAALGEPFERLFGTPHGLDVAGAVAMCGGRHVGVASPEELTAAVEDWLGKRGLTVIEVHSDRAVGRDLHARLIDAALETVRTRHLAAGTT